ncbi:TetR/AcrR family transcriptional regulator [Amycolatopsis sp. NPDC051045]|uniref:TetR/AcrR family transcriptional regulator n=1 Tax=Amycolatopsis sp. NPDC051045 TaxID=3156922 RepID=UPI00341371B0
MDKRGRRRTLSEQAILDAALGLLAERGADAVTVRGIAARVGVAPNAVYTYFPDKAAVVRGLAEHLLGRVDHDRFADASQPWRDRVRALALELRAELLAHPGSVHLMLGHPPDGPHTQAVRETLLAVLVDAGLGPSDAAEASYLVNVHILGAVAFEAAAPPEDSDVAAGRFRWGLDRLLDGLAARVATGGAEPAAGNAP